MVDPRPRVGNEPLPAGLARMEQSAQPFYAVREDLLRQLREEIRQKIEVEHNPREPHHGPSEEEIWEAGRNAGIERAIEIIKEFGDRGGFHFK